MGRGTGAQERQGGSCTSRRVASPWQSRLAHRKGSRHSKEGPSHLDRSVRVRRHDHIAAVGHRQVVDGVSVAVQRLHAQARARVPHGDGLVARGAADVRGEGLGVGERRGEGAGWGERWVDAARRHHSKVKNDHGDDTSIAPPPPPPPTHKQCTRAPRQASNRPQQVACTHSCMHMHLPVDGVEPDGGLDRDRLGPR